MQLNGTVVLCSGAESADGIVYTTDGYGFICLPRNITEKLIEKYASNAEPPSDKAVIRILIEIRICAENTQKFDSDPEHFEMDGKVIFGIGDFKYMQMA